MAINTETICMAIENEWRRASKEDCSDLWLSILDQLYGMSSLIATASNAGETAENLFDTYLLRDIARIRLAWSISPVSHKD